MTFEEAHEQFISGHLNSRPEGERQARLEWGHLTRLICRLQNCRPNFAPSIRPLLNHCRDLES